MTLTIIMMIIALNTHRLYIRCGKFSDGQTRSWIVALYLHCNAYWLYMKFSSERTYKVILGVIGTKQPVRSCMDSCRIATCPNARKSWHNKKLSNLSFSYSLYICSIVGLQSSSFPPTGIFVDICRYV